MLHDRQRVPRTVGRSRNRRPAAARWSPWLMQLPGSMPAFPVTANRHCVNGTGLSEAAAIAVNVVGAASLQVILQYFNSSHKHGQPRWSEHTLHALSSA